MSNPRRMSGHVLFFLTLACALSLVSLGGNGDVSGHGAGVSIAGERQDVDSPDYPAGVSERLKGLKADRSTATGIAVDSAGNAYVTGQWVNTAGESGFATIKYDSAGRKKWVKSYIGPAKGTNRPSSIALDSSGNAYVTGMSQGDSGPNNHDFATIKYDRNGNQLWVKRYKGPAKGSDSARGLAVDSKGNVYVTGDSQKSANQWDLTTIKYDSSGRQLWTKFYNSAYRGSSSPTGIAVDSSGNAYLTGDSQSGERAFDFATIKYDSSGKQIWAKRYTPPGSSFNFPVGLSMSRGSVYVGGSTQGQTGALTIVKYEVNTGKQVWAKTFNSGHGSDNPTGIAADMKGNAYLTGTSGDGDFLTVRYDSSGKHIWTRTYNGPGKGYDSTKGIAVDSSGCVYVTGQSSGKNTGTDFTTVKYAPGGKTYWVRRFNGKGNGEDGPEAIAVDKSGNVYVTGQSQLGPSGDYGFATVKYDSSGKQTWVTYFSGQ